MVHDIFILLQSRFHFTLLTLSSVCGSLLKYPVSGFDLEPRSKEFLPKEFPANIEGPSYFLNGYNHKDVDVNLPLDLHIQHAIREYELGASM